jgi:hypothetical protein
MMTIKMEANYINPKSTASFGGANRLRIATKPRPSLHQTLKYLEGLPAYTLHKQRRYKFKRNRFIITGIDDTWQADLADFASLSTANDGYKYVLVVIDSLSKYVWAVKLRQKNASTVLPAIKLILRQASPRKPLNFLVDKGGEFKNVATKTYMKEQGINFYTTKNPDTKAAIAERVIRTLKGRIYRYLTHNNTKKYIDILDDVVDSYNSSKHRSIGMAPNEVTKETEKAALRKLYPGKLAPMKTFRFSNGDNVRLAKEKNPFQKGYHPLWTEEVFTVTEVIPRDPVVYKVADQSGEAIEGTFYEQEMQKVTMKPDDAYRIENVLKTRKRGRKKEYFVKWLGYPDTMNSWIDESALIVS